MALLSTTFGKILSSRTVWGAAVLGAIPVIQAISPMVPSGTKAGAVIGVILALWTVYCRIRAKQPLGPVIDSTIAQTVEAIHVLGISTTVPTTITGKVDQIANVTAVVKASQ